MAGTPYVRRAVVRHRHPRARQCDAALERLREHHKREVGFSDITGLLQKQWFINEPGFYRLVLRSNKPEAERFQDWVTEEVLPSIRRTGVYRVTTRRLVDNKRGDTSHLRVRVVTMVSSSADRRR